MQEFKSFWKRSFDFKGVSTLKEYWMAYFFNYLVNMALGMIFYAGMITQMSVLMEDDPESFITMLVFMIPLFIYMLVSLIPNLSITVRRLHDINKSGFLFFLSFIPLIGGIAVIILTVMKSNYINNPYVEKDLMWRRQHNETLPEQWQQPILSDIPPQIQQQRFAQQQPVEQQPIDLEEPQHFNPAEQSFPVQQQSTQPPPIIISDIDEVPQGSLNANNDNDEPQQITQENSNQ